MEIPDEAIAYQYDTLLNRMGDALELDDLQTAGNCFGGIRALFLIGAITPDQFIAADDQMRATAARWANNQSKEDTK